MNKDRAGDKRRRHCMVVHAYYPLNETRVQREAEALVDSGYEVDVICLRHPGEPPEARYRSVQIHRLPVERKRGGLATQLLNYLHFFVLAAAKLVQLDRRHRYDTIQVHNLPDFLVFCALIPKLRGRAIILDLHDLMPEFYASRFGQDGRSVLARLVRWQERLACRFADHVITVSEHWREALIRRGVAPEKCSVVMNVADTNIFKPAADEHSARPQDGAFRLIYHGTIPERYGLDLAIGAVAKLRHEIPGVHLTIVGGGDHLPKLVRMAYDLGLQNHVTFVGVRQAEELLAFVSAAHLGVVPYRNDVFTDALVPTKMMEYAAMGIPVVAARTSAIAAYFGDAMVEFFTPGDADDLTRCIRSLWRSPERLAELARGSEKFNQRYNWAKLGADYVALVERLGNRSAWSHRTEAAK